MVEISKLQTLNFTNKPKGKSVSNNKNVWEEQIVLNRNFETF